jgi:hypothetical protein
MRASSDKSRGFVFRSSSQQQCVPESEESLSVSPKEEEEEEEQPRKQTDSPAHLGK